MGDVQKWAGIREGHIQVDGLTIRYLEAGSGQPVLMLHGASLGSSCDVFIRNMEPLAKAGFRTIAYDQPGFGLSDTPNDLSTPYRRKFIPKLADALALGKVALFAHSQSGSMAWQLALETPERYSHLIVLGTGSLLPPLEEKKQGLDAAAQQRLERRMAAKEPTIEDTRKLLEANLFHHELITDDELALRHSRSIGKAFEAFTARSEQEETAPKKAKSGPEHWERVDELKVPSLLIYGREDRANAFERVSLWKAKYPSLNLHIVNGCKHLVPWDAADEVMRLSIPFMKN
jgi:4,5:9,10-diseco-3-hydroxy-5,9,17-trioxoandrosta-1(10),2-diene-4-oate hydrolase